MHPLRLSDLWNGGFSVLSLFFLLSSHSLCYTFSRGIFPFLVTWETPTHRVERILELQDHTMWVFMWLKFFFHHFPRFKAPFRLPTWARSRILGAQKGRTDSAMDSHGAARS
jgi:hypothetical protein